MLDAPDIATDELTVEDIARLLQKAVRALLTKMAWAKSLDSASREDVASEVLRELYENAELRARIVSEDGVIAGPLLWIVVQRQLQDYRRDRCREAGHVSTNDYSQWEPPDHRETDREANLDSEERYRGFLAGLEASDRDIVVLKHSGLTQTEIAALVGVSQTTVHRRLGALYPRLRAALGLPPE